MNTSNSTQVINIPYMSANKLSEFRLASDAKKKSIIKTLKYPTTFKNGYYTAAKAAFVKYMADENHQLEILQHKKEAILATNGSISDWQKNNNKGSIEVLENFTVLAETTLVDYLHFVAQKKVQKDAFVSNINGVNINLTPEIILTDKQTGEIKGFIKLVLSKTRKIDWQEADFTAATIKEKIEKVFNVKLKSKNCLVLDVFNIRKYEAPRYGQLSKQHLKLTCAEIAAMWPAITN